MNQTDSSGCRKADKLLCIWESSTYTRPGYCSKGIVDVTRIFSCRSDLQSCLQLFIKSLFSIKSP